MNPTARRRRCSPSEDSRDAPGTVDIRTDPSPRPRPRRHRGVRRAGGSSGFTLIETMFAVLIIGLGVVVILRSMMLPLLQHVVNPLRDRDLPRTGNPRVLALPNHDRFAGGIYFTDPPTPEHSRVGRRRRSADRRHQRHRRSRRTRLRQHHRVPRRLRDEPAVPGPINSFGEVISEVRFDGTTEMIEVDGDMVPVSMRGWSQPSPSRRSTLSTTSRPRQRRQRHRGRRTRRRRVPAQSHGHGHLRRRLEDHAPPLSVISWVVPPR